MDLTRKTAFDVLYGIEQENTYSNLALNRYIAENRPENPALVRELVYGVLENKILLDYILDKLIPSGIKKVKKKEKTILRMGLYQILFTDGIPAYAAVSQSVNMAKKICRGREGFINGVLRGYIRKKDEISLPDKEKDIKSYLSVKYSFPIWIIELWIEEYGLELCEELLQSSNKRPKLSIRVNLLKSEVSALKDTLVNMGFEVDEGKFSARTLHVKGSGLLDTEEYKTGLFSVQDEASTVAADMIEATDESTVIDVCAAPGGKTMAIAEKMNNSGQIIACDIYEHKLNIIDAQAKRLGIKIIGTKLLDGTKGDQSMCNSADRVLVDVPCSGLGVIRRKPEIKYKGQGDFAELIDIQSNILKKSAQYVKINGILVYSTCTLNNKENQNQTKKFIENNKNFEIIDERCFLPTEDIDGFYVCKMRKKGE